MTRKKKYRLVMIIATVLTFGLYGLFSNINYGIDWDFSIILGTVGFWMSLFVANIIFKDGASRKCKKCSYYSKKYIHTGKGTQFRTHYCFNTEVVKNKICPYKNSIKFEYFCYNRAVIETESSPLGWL
jgi:hypothetical protein